MNKRYFVGLLVVLMLVPLFLSFGVSSGAVNINNVYQGNNAQVVAQDFGSALDYDYSMHLSSFLSLPSNWYLNYIMGFYFMNSTDEGYYIGLRQYLGSAWVIISPVVDGNYYGSDGIVNHTGMQIPVGGLDGLNIIMSYNYTTHRFRITQGSSVYVDNDFSGMALSKFKVDNSLGRDGVSGNVIFIAWGADHADGSYDNPVTNGVRFRVCTDGVESGTGGSVSWYSSNVYGIGGNGTSGYYGSPSIMPMDGVTVFAVPNVGYVFDHFVYSVDAVSVVPVAGWYIFGNYSNNYNPSATARLIANRDFSHIYATEAGRVFRSPNYSGGGYTYYWQNGTNYVGSTWVLAYSNGFGVVSGNNPVVAEGQNGVRYDSPFGFQFFGRNVTIMAYFTTINFDASDMGDGQYDYENGGVNGWDNGYGNGGYNPTPIVDGSGAGNFQIGSMVSIVSILLIIFVLPMLVLVGVPKLGTGGFMVVLSLFVCVGVYVMILPSYFLIFLGLGIGLMFLSAVKKGM